jgi:fructose-1,6-bisphosphatase
MSNNTKRHATNHRMSALSGNLRYYAADLEAAADNLARNDRDEERQHIMRYMRSQISLMREYLDSLEAASKEEQR